MMGSNSHYPEEAPSREVSVGAFMISSHEVTNSEFAAFVKATGYVTTAEKPIPPDKYPDLPEAYRVPGAMVFVMPDDTLQQLVPSTWWVFTPDANWRHPSGPASTIEGHANDPVTQVSWEDAKAYAKWRGHDLPTEAEWEWAARAGGDVASDDLQPDANIWEGIFPFFDTASDGYHGLAPVGCFKPNGYGLYDMIGNVWEWTEDLYRPSHSPDPSFVDDPRHPQRRVIKGGSWMCSNTYCGRYRPSARQPGDADLGSSHTGFRTVLRSY
jgi:formylglycine-generating enzyme required for sulfatase activity